MPGRSSSPPRTQDRSSAHSTSKSRRASCAIVVSPPHNRQIIAAYARGAKQFTAQSLASAKLVLSAFTPTVQSAFRMYSSHTCSCLTSVSMGPPTSKSTARIVMPTPLPPPPSSRSRCVSQVLAAPQLEREARHQQPPLVAPAAQVLVGHVLDPSRVEEACTAQARGIEHVMHQAGERPAEPVAEGHTEPLLSAPQDVRGETIAERAL